MNGHGAPEVDRYNAAHDPRAALSVPLLRRTIAEQQGALADLAAELAPRDRVPEARVRVEAVATARAEARESASKLLDLLLEGVGPA